MYRKSEPAYVGLEVLFRVVLARRMLVAVFGTLIMSVIPNK
jgi:hypothetical protein